MDYSNQAGYLYQNGQKQVMEGVTINPDVLAGKPVIKGTRIPVYLILQLLENGKTIQEIVSDYPRLSVQDVKNAIRYAELVLKREEIFLRP